MELKIFYPSELTEQFSLELNLNKAEFIDQFQDFIAPDRGYFLDELSGEKKIYLGHLDSHGFVLRKRRKFLRFGSSPAAAKAELFELNGKTRLEVEILAFDPVSRLGQILGTVFFLVLIGVVISRQAYPALILLIPFLIALLIFQRSSGRNRMKAFKTELLRNLSAVDDLNQH